MASRWIEIGAGKARTRAYVAVPAGGSGPGLALFHEDKGLDGHATRLADLLAEEGYVVLAPDDPSEGSPDATIAALRQLPEFDGAIGALGFGGGGTRALEAAAAGSVACAIVYYGEGLEAVLDRPGAVDRPTLFHFAGDDESAAGINARLKAEFPSGDVETYVYRGAGFGFAAPDSDAYDKSSAELAYSRSLALLRRVIGPRYDLNTIWDRHTEVEFVTRDAEATMATMVAEPYVNHVPVMTGGTGYQETLRFYKNHFIPTTPKDSHLVAISRTVGADRIVDEILFCFTHDSEIDWMLPGIPPTGKYVEIPLVVIVQFRGDRIYNEHIYWDQASVLVQIGVLDASRYPVAGRETARKVYDEYQPSNTLMRRWQESASKAAS
jgi:carboxymethylenebutenolidase